MEHGCSLHFLQHGGVRPRWRLLMDEKVARLKTPEECGQFIKNVEEKYPELAREARRRAVELRAAAHGATNAAEKEALQAVYAYEELLSNGRGKRIRATRTWQMIQRRGIMGAVEQLVQRKDVTSGYRELV